MWNCGSASTETGIGISFGKPPPVFRAFAQVDSSSTRTFGGNRTGDQHLNRQLGSMLDGCTNPWLEITMNQGAASTISLLVRSGFRRPSPNRNVAGILPGTGARNQHHGCPCVCVDD